MCVFVFVEGLSSANGTMDDVVPVEMSSPVSAVGWIRTRGGERERGAGTQVESEAAEGGAADTRGAGSEST